MTKGTQKLDYQPGATKYFTNCRGFNYVPVMYSEWEKSGFLPRQPKDIFTLLAGPAGTAIGLLYAFDSSATFKGANKTSQWWYYNHDDNDNCLKIIRQAGVNAIRVFTNIYVWEKKRQQHLEDLKDFMKICDKYKIRVQLVLWDGVYIPVGSNTQEPGTSFAIEKQTVNGIDLFNDPVYFGLYQNWNRIPFEYQVSSEAATQQFFSNSATPFINDICSSLSSFQSFWSFDIGNETDSALRPYVVSSLFVSTSYLISSLLSSIGVGLTFGNGDTFRLYSGTLVGGPNNGTAYPKHPTDLIQYSSIYNFASIHPYITNSKMVCTRYVDEAVSASKIIGKPSMFNEGGAVPHTYYSNIVEWFSKDNNYGGMPWQSMIDLGVTHLPFADSQGIFHWDGKVRRFEDAFAYTDLALYHGWLKRSQLKFKFEEKQLSEDGGFDGGYYSATIPWHASYDPNIHVSTTKDKWEFIAAATYNAPALNFVGSQFSGAFYPIGISKNYVPYYDKQPFSPLITSYISEGIELPSYVSACRNYKTAFTSFSSILTQNGIAENVSVTGLSAGPIYKQLNEQAVRKIYILERCSLFIMNVWQLIPQAYLIGSQYDYLPASSLRLSFSGHFWDYMRGFDDGDGSSITCWADSESLENASSTKHWTYGTGLYITPGNKNSNLDWWEYDRWFNQSFEYVNQYLDVLENLAQTNPKYKLY